MCRTAVTVSMIQVSTGTYTIIIERAPQREEEEGYEKGNYG